MKKYMVEISESAKQDLENIVLYLRYNLAGDIIADKYNFFSCVHVLLLLSVYSCPASPLCGRMAVKGGLNNGFKVTQITANL